MQLWYSNVECISQEIHATDVLTAIKSSLDYRRKHALWLLNYTGDCALLKTDLSKLKRILLAFSKTWECNNTTLVFKPLNDSAIQI